MIYVIRDERKHKYLVDIKERMVSGICTSMVTTKIGQAHKFSEPDEEQLAQFEKLLNYEQGELQYEPVSI